MNHSTVTNLRIRLNKSGLPREVIGEHIRCINNLESSKKQLEFALRALFPGNDWQANLVKHTQRGVKPTSYEKLIVQIREAVALDPKLLNYELVKKGRPLGSSKPKAASKKNLFPKKVHQAQSQVKRSAKLKLKLRHVFVSPLSSQDDKLMALNLLVDKPYDLNSKQSGSGRSRTPVEVLWQRELDKYQDNERAYLNYPRIGAPPKNLDQDLIYPIKEVLVHKLQDALSEAFTFPEPPLKNPYQATQLTQADKDQLASLVLGSSLDDSSTYGILTRLYPKAKPLREILRDRIKGFYRLGGRPPVSLEERYLQIKAKAENPDVYISAQLELERLRKRIEAELAQELFQLSESEQSTDRQGTEQQSTNQAQGSEAQGSTHEPSTEPGAVSTAATSAEVNLEPQVATTEPTSPNGQTVPPPQAFNPIEQRLYIRDSSLSQHHQLRKFLKELPAMPESARAVKSFLTSVLVIDGTVLPGGSTDISEVEYCPDPMDKDNQILGVKLSVATSILTRAPMFFRTYPGATSDFTIIRDFIRRAAKHGIDKLCWAQDRGHESEAARADAYALGHFFVQMVRSSNNLLKAKKSQALLEIAQDQFKHKSISFKGDYLHLTQGTAATMGMVDYHRNSPLNRKTISLGTAEREKLEAYVKETDAEDQEHVTYEGIQYLNTAYKKRTKAKSDQKPKACWKRVYYYKHSSTCNLVTSCNYIERETNFDEELVKQEKLVAELNKQGVTQDSPEKVGDYIKLFSTRNKHGKQVGYTYGVDMNALATTYATDGYCLITNLEFPDLDLSTDRGRLAYCEAVRFIYACRWTSELGFRSIKSGINMRSMFSRHAHTYATKLCLMMIKEIIDRLSWFLANRNAKELIRATEPQKEITKLYSGLRASTDESGAYKTKQSSKEFDKAANGFGLALTIERMNLLAGAIA